MQRLYQAKGLLSREFIGQITYTFCLPYALDELDICLAFDKQHYDSPEQVPVEELMDYCRSHYDTRDYARLSREELAELFFRETKTEIHLSAMLNDQFIGCIHKQLTCRHMHFGSDALSEGCLMPEMPMKGVLKVTVLAFQILMDDTPYTVTVSGQRAGDGERAEDIEKAVETEEAEDIEKAVRARGVKDIGKASKDEGAERIKKAVEAEKIEDIEKTVKTEGTREADKGGACHDIPEA